MGLSVGAVNVAVKELILSSKRILVHTDAITGIVENHKLFIEIGFVYQKSAQTTRRRTGKSRMERGHWDTGVSNN